VNPVLLVIAGPNGAGKTTVTVKLRSERWSDNVEYLNPDDIARDRFGDWNSPEASLGPLLRRTPRIAPRSSDARRRSPHASNTSDRSERFASSTSHRT
jgi:predicted ABC-type ATPase